MAVTEVYNVATQLFIHHYVPPSLPPFLPPVLPPVLKPTHDGWEAMPPVPTGLKTPRPTYIVQW